jgi:hypothetical protein
MPLAIVDHIRNQVIKEWLSGNSRNDIATKNKIGAGTVSNIINEWKKGLDNSEYESIRELAVLSKKEAMTLSDVAANVRLNNYIQKLGANVEQIESFIANIANSQDPQKLVDTANQVAQISTSESIHLDMMADYIKQQKEDKQRLEEEIQEAEAELQSKNTDTQTLNNYKKLEEQLNSHRLSMAEPQMLVSVLHTIRQIGYSPHKVVRELTRIKSLSKLKNQLRALELRMAQYREILPLCQQIASFRIGFPELLAFYSAVTKRADTENIQIHEAAFQLLQDIEDYNTLGDMKKHLYDTGMQIQMMNQIMARQNNAIVSLIRLQGYGMTGNEIINVNEFLIRARSESGQNLIRNNK